jgi:eukaryotic-like serine/threonine-protein kinase
MRAPIANEEERGQFQRRLGLTSLLLFVLAGTFWLITAISIAVVAPHEAHHLWTSHAGQAQLAATSLGLFVWIYTELAPRSAGALDAADLLCAMGICTGWAAMASFQQPHVRPDLVGLLACTYTLIMRSALIPSTPARSAVVSAVALVPLIAVTHLRVANQPTTSLLSPAVYAAIWAVLAVGATTTTSYVIYGLRLEVRKAMQLGQYLLEEKIGEGGMGTVYRASHALLRRPTAIKLLSGGTEQAIERFEREVQLTASLTHPNTIAVFDYGRTPDGVFYYAMEFLDGVTLEDLVDATGAQPPSRVVHVLLQACGALREAHAAGLVHRDIKPANLMLTTRGGVLDFVKVLDFGLVKEAPASAGAALTHQSAILGTPYYMAPESILDPQSVDGRADIYALGATAFYLLTGKRVFDGASLVEVCSKHLHEAPALPSSVRAGLPASLDRIVLACLAKKPEGRPQDALELARMLRDAGIAPWTEADAVRWWSENADRRPRATPSPSMLGETIPVAIEGRVSHRAAHARSRLWTTDSLNDSAEPERQRRA